MKRKSLLLTLMVCLCASIFCFACGKKNEGHKHKYTEVAEVTSTCVTQGVKAHYKCDDCGKLFELQDGKYVEVTEDDLKLPLAAHTFDGIVVTANPTKTVYNAFEQFDMAGIAVSKHCTVAGCNGEAVAAEEVTFEYEKDGADKLTADMTKVVIKVGDYSADLAITVNKITVNLPTIDSKEYNGAAQVADVAASDLYTVTENNGGTAVGEYDVKLTLKDAVNYAFENTEGATVTLKFAITKISNTITIGEIAAISCKQTPTITATANEDATISYVYSATEDGEYTENIDGGFVAGTYYIKAIATETANYMKTTSAAKSFTVNHALHVWNTEDDEQDVGICACGEELTDVVFNKVVIDARRDIILTDVAHSLTLGGISAYASVKSIKYGELSFGNDISALNLPAELSDALHGEQNLTIIVTDDYGLDHTVTVPVTIVTDKFSTVDALISAVAYQSTDSGKTHEGKYYILTGDISFGGNYQSAVNAGTQKGNGFAGTLDGRNHTISGGNMFGGGIFGAIEGGTVKNLKFTGVNPVGANRTLFASSVRNAIFDNISIKTHKVTLNDPGHFFGVIASSHANNVTMKDVTIDMGESVVPWLLGKGGGNADASTYHCENVNITLGNLKCFATDSTSGKMLYLDQLSGVKYKLSGGATAEETIDPKNFDDGFVYTLTSPWNRYSAIKSVKLGDTDITESVMIFGDDEKVLAFDNLADYITADMYNKTVTFTVELEAGENNTVVIALSVGVLDINEAVELTTRQDVVLKDADGDKTTFTLNLGDYSGYTITKVEYNGEDLTFTGNAITISDAMKNGTHGEQTIYVTAAGDKVNYRIAVPVTIVTETFSTIDRLMAVIGYKDSSSGLIDEGKYYTLAQDIQHTKSYSVNKTGDPGDKNGFAGTFDGRGYTLDGGNFYGGGLFGTINGGTVKNLKFINVNAVDTKNNRTLLAVSMYNATLENISIKTYSLKEETGGVGSSFGVITSGRVVNLTMKGVTIDMGNSAIPWVFGKGLNNASASNYKCENVIIKAKSIDCLAKNSNSDGLTLANDAVSGITVTTAA